MKRNKTSKLSDIMYLKVKCMTVVKKSIWGCPNI